MKEDRATYGGDDSGETEHLFFHEKLDVYQRGLELIEWVDSFLFIDEIAPRYATGLDKTSTGVVLNIAEGNGRYSSRDHRRFLDIAQTCAMNTASGLDVLAAKGFVSIEQIEGGKRVLAKLVPLLLGLRATMDQTSRPD